MIPHRFRSYAEFTRHLGDREYFGAKLGLERVRRVLERLLHPEQKFPSVHIAGTNGKGSTAAMIDSILRQAGYQVGLFTSPHLEDYCERIQVGGEKIRPEEVLHWGRVLQEVEEEPLTFFEMTTLIAFLHFAEKKVPLVLLETGLGGRLDATNVVTPLVSVITTIGLDHRQHLGNTLEEIAREKGGIIKEGIPVVSGVDQPEIRQILERMAEAQKAPFVTAEAAAVQPALAGAHQRRNAAVALEVIRLLRARDYFIPPEAVMGGLSSVTLPGRLEVMSNEPLILLDGAHNPPAAEALAAYLRGCKGDWDSKAPSESGRRPCRLTLLFGAMADKDWRGMLQELVPLASHTVFVRPTLKRAEDPFKLQEEASHLGGESEVIPNIPQALQRVIKTISPRGVLVVTGSFFTVGEARRFLRVHGLERLLKSSSASRSS